MLKTLVDVVEDLVKDMDEMASVLRKLATGPDAELMSSLRERSESLRASLVTVKEWVAHLERLDGVPRTLSVVPVMPERPAAPDKTATDIPAAGQPVKVAVDGETSDEAKRTQSALKELPPESEAAKV